MLSARPPESTANTLSLGIDIGSRATKFILLEKNPNNRIDIQAAGSFDIPPGIVQEGVVQNPKVFGRLLQAQLEESSKRLAGGVVSIPSNLAVLRWVTLPLLEGDERREAARFKVKKHLPFPAEKAYIDVSRPIVEADGSAGQSLVIAVKKEVIDSRAAALEAAGVNPVGAELEAQAILRVVERRLNQQSVLWRDASLTIIDVGGTNTHMYVVQNQQLQFIRGVKFGADLFAHAVMTSLDVDRPKAEELMGHPNTRLLSEGLLTIQSDDVFALVNVQTEMEKLTREFLRLLRYFRSLHPERSYAGILDHAIVCGGLVGLQGFAEFLEDSIGLRVERARPFAGMVAQLKRETFQSVSSRQEAFTVVMGLALSGLQRVVQGTGETHAGRQFVWARAA